MPIFTAAAAFAAAFDFAVGFGGETQISRFRHGWMLLKMVAFAFLKITAI
ncbi:hypothetical protein L6654_06870 [Bradyrhizobium sp. WYCCWR 13023]|uniref:Uncharacterized protein n=1 Tax=Bradyrhizobium zhengyangense TaxID=2911009 RepID=A0A9X1R7C5_9BRAD|nr:hypothetical protein [Bradyrhizobium zhengyangense]MCG2626345.1 hypothetical protein [Bradyrhizobium zhengyangense]